MTQKTALTFPCDFPIKIFGHANTNFETNVVGIVRKHFPNVSEAAFKLNQSKEAKYLAITVTVHATSQTELDALYQELSTNDQVVMVL